MPEPISPLLNRVRESVAGTYDFLGELGPDEQGVVLYLARTLATGALVGLSVQQVDAHGDEYAVEERRTLGETVQVRGNACPECHTPLPDLERFCFQCGADLSGLFGPGGPPEETRLLHALATATAGQYEILGRLLRDGTAGMVYFARELVSQRIVALRLRRAEPADNVQAEFVVRQTAIFGPPVAAPTRAPAQSAPAAPHVDAAPVAESSQSASRSFSKRAPVLGGLTVLVIATAGYFALRPDSDAGVASSERPSVDTTAARSVAVPTVSDTSAVTAPNTDPAANRTDGAAAPSDGNGGRSGPSADSGTVRILALPADARVTVDGRTVRGRTLTLRAGEHTVAVSAAGFEPLTQKFRVTAGRDLKLSPALVALAKAATAPSGDGAAPRPAPKPTCRTATRESRWTAAFELCSAEAAAGDVAAMANLARQYQRGVGVSASVTQAYSWFEKAARGGDAESQVFVALALREGQNVKRDEKESARWFKSAADAGNTTAQFEYGVALERGKGTKKDEAAARESYRKAAEGGNGDAAFRLARLVERGDGGPRSDEQAAVAYERGAALGHAESALTIAKWYRDGRGVAKSPEKSLQWFKKAAELGNEDAKREVEKLEKGKR